MKTTILTLLLMTVSTSITFSQHLSDEITYESKFLEIKGHQLHYIDEGTGDVILFLHGVPLNLNSWRNVIPDLADSNRCVAIDFMGFGKSDKPDINYSFVEQYQYLETFIKEMKLTNIILVMTDIGGVLGNHYASKHPDNIKGLVMMETPIGDARTFHKNGGMMQHMLFGMASKEKFGKKMFVKKNMMFKMLPKLTKRKLSDSLKSKYLEPFKNEEDRLPLFSLPNAFPKKGKNVKENDMGDFMNKNNAWLIKSELPKLIVHAKPGMLMTKKTLSWAKTNYKNLEVDFLGKGKHLLEEDLPNEIGQSIVSWMRRLK